MHSRAPIIGVRYRSSSSYAFEELYQRHSQQISTFLCTRGALSRAFTTNIHPPMHSRGSIKGVHNRFSSSYAFESSHQRHSQRIFTFQCIRETLSKAFATNFQAPMHSRSSIKGIRNRPSPFNASENLYQRR